MHTLHYKVGVWSISNCHNTNLPHAGLIQKKIQILQEILLIYWKTSKRPLDQRQYQKLTQWHDHWPRANWFCLPVSTIFLPQWRSLGSCHKCADSPVWSVPCPPHNESQWRGSVCHHSFQHPVSKICTNLYSTFTPLNTSGLFCHSLILVKLRLLE